MPYGSPISQNKYIFLLYSFIDSLMRPQIPKSEIHDIGLVSNIAFNSSWLMNSLAILSLCLLNRRHLPISTSNIDVISPVQGKWSLNTIVDWVEPAVDCGHPPSCISRVNLDFMTTSNSTVGL